jgi:tetratricopeptide (TPR) repeat protein
LVVIDTPGLRPAQDIILKMPEPQNKLLEADIGSAVISTELFLIEGMDAKGRRLFHILINMLGPGQSYTFVLENRAPFGTPKALISVQQFGTKPEMTRILSDSRLKTFYSEALSLQKQGKHDEALSTGRSALAWAKENFGDDSFQVADAENSLAYLFAEQHKLVEAAIHYQNALEGIERAVGPNAKAMGEVLRDMAHLYCEMGKPEDAKAFSDRANRILRLFED